MIERYIETLKRIHSREVHEFYEYELKGLIEKMSNEMKREIIEELYKRISEFDKDTTNDILLRFGLGALLLFTPVEKEKEVSQMDQCLSVFDNLIQILSHQTIQKEFVRKMKAICFHFVARVYMVMHRNEEALENLKKAIHLEKNFTSAYNNSGLIYHLLHRADEAIAMYTKAIELCESYAAGHYNRGNSYYYLRKYNEAVENYRTAVWYDPDFLSSYYNESLCHNHLFEYVLALQCICKCENNFSDRVQAKALKDKYYQHIIPACMDPLWN
jgi:tetratricopeptide (TPR) repeat protein